MCLYCKTRKILLNLLSCSGLLLVMVHLVVCQTHLSPCENVSG